MQFTGPIHVLGINDLFDIVKLSGFYERVHASGDTTDFRSYNDSLYVTDLGLYKATADSIQGFIHQLIALNSWFGPNLEGSKNSQTLVYKILVLNAPCLAFSVDQAASGPCSWKTGPARPQEGLPSGLIRPNGAIIFQTALIRAEP